MSCTNLLPSRRLRIALRAVLAVASLSLTLAPSLAGQEPIAPARPRTELDGPRFGLTYLSAGLIDAARKKQIVVSPVITQFGWQFEHRLYGGRGGELQALSELVLLVGGMDQGLLLPSASWLLGLRSENGFEFAVGPNATAAGIALAMAVGYTYRTGRLNVPVNIAVVPSASGMRVSVLTGFNMLR